MDAEFAIEVAERLAKLEESQRAAEKSRDEMKENISEMTAEFREVKDTLVGMREELARYRGFWGGALLVVSAVWAFLQLGWGWIETKLHGGG
jgi:Flp pilus assembly protein TadB